MSTVIDAIGNLHGGDGRFAGRRHTESDTMLLDDLPELCPVCGDPADYCQGHGEIGDPAGYRLLVAHDVGDDSGCVAECHSEPVVED